MTDSRSAKTLAYLKPLIQEARAGSAKALDELLGYFRTVLRRHLRSVPRELRSKDTPSDLVQEALLDASQDFQRFHGDTPEELMAWLRGILEHKLGNYFRHWRSTAKRQVTREISLEENQARAEVEEALCDTRNAPESAAIANEESRLARLAYAQLSPEYQGVLRLRAWSGLPFEEIGALLGCSADAARKLYKRAYAKFVQERLFLKHRPAVQP